MADEAASPVPPTEAMADVDDEFLDDPPDDPVEYARAVEALKARVSAADIDYEEQVRWDSERHPAILLPAGRGKRRVPAYTLDEVNSLLAVPFEKYTFLGPYDAICSYSDGLIEAAVRSLRGPASARMLMRRLRSQSAPRASDGGAVEAILLRQPSGEGPEVLLGSVSKDLATLTRGLPRISITIRNAQVHQQDQAIEVLETIADALFFEIDLKYDIALGLQRARTGPTRLRAHTRAAEEVSLQFPRSEYDTEPMSLYWYARGATGLPLLQYLAYYQVLEFYFPIYSDRDVHERVKNILRHPVFDPHSDTQVSRVVRLLRSNRARLDDERAQLRSTLQACVHEDGLREFLERDADRREFLTRDKSLRVHRLQLNNKEADLRSEAASRVYEIRCKIVHTKSVDGAAETELLLPHSKEAQSLHFDIELIQYLARETLIANSRQLSI